MTTLVFDRPPRPAASIAAATARATLRHQRRTALERRNLSSARLRVFLTSSITA